MKKLIALLCLLFGLAIGASAQSNVAIALGSGYSGGAATFTNLNPQGYSGRPQNAQILSVFLDASGAATLTTLGTGNQWRVMACKSDGTECLLTTVSVTGGAQDITTALEAYPIGTGVTSGLTGTLTATRIPFASDATTLDDDADLTWDNTKKSAYSGPAFATFNASMQSYGQDPDDTTSGLIGAGICTGTNCRARGGLFYSESDNAVGIEGYAVNHITTLGAMGGDVVGGQFLSAYTTTVTTTRGAVGLNGYAYVNSDMGHTSGGAVGVNGFASNAGVGVPLSDAWPIASFITYGNTNASASAVPLNVGYYASPMPAALGGGGATLNAAFYAADQGTGAGDYAYYSAGGKNYFAGPLITATHTPSAANDTGVTGTIAWDASYIYIATNTNTWKRVAIATWP